jgi:hypothetical protein
MKPSATKLPGASMMDFYTLPVGSLIKSIVCAFEKRLIDTSLLQETVTVDCPPCATRPISPSRPFIHPATAGPVHSRSFIHAGPLQQMNEPVRS